LDEVDDTSILKTGHLARHRRSLLWKLLAARPAGAARYRAAI